MYYSQSVPLAIFAQDEFGKGHSKTAEGMLRYGRNPIVAVIDKSEAGKKVSDVVNINSDVPIVASIAECLQFKPKALLMGTAWIGGNLPEHWRPEIIQALESGLDVINGMHEFLQDDEQISSVAKETHRKLIDVRKVSNKIKVASGAARTVPAITILTVGTDCSSGKMTTSIEITNAIIQAGYTAKFQATGQTGIMIEGDGIAIDRVIGDFMAGAAEELVLEAGCKHDFVLVEGQGSLLHPGFSGVTLSLLHGCAPQAMILCHNANQTHINNDVNFPIPPLAEVVAIYESMAKYIRPSKVIGIALNTNRLNEKEALKALTDTEIETGLPVVDPVRFRSEKLVQLLLKLRSRKS